MKSLVVCIGNAMRSDDGVGLSIGEELRAKGVNVILLRDDASSILESVQGVDRLVLVDAIDFGGEPGSVISGRIEELESIEMRSSTHSLSPIFFLNLIKELTGYPREAFAVGIQPKSLELGGRLSEEVEAALPTAVETVLKILSQQ